MEWDPLVLRMSSGLRSRRPSGCDLGGGVKVVAVAHLPELGGVNGALVLRPSQFDRRVLAALKDRGFACSSFSDPHDSEEYDLEGYREMFIDWGWTSESREAPPWIMPKEADDG